MGTIATAQDPAAATFTFGANITVYFRLLLAAPEQSRETQLSVRHIPYSNVNVVSIGGLMPGYIRGQALFASYADFLNVLNNAVAQPPNTQPASLSYAEGTYPVYLTKISRRRVPGGSGGYMIADVEFLISS